MKRLSGRFLTVAVSSLLALVLGEGILRLLDVNPGQMNAGYLQFGYRQGIPTVDEDGVLEEGRPVKIRLFRSHSEWLWETVPGTTLTNSMGFRGTREYEVPKPPGKFRIVFLGDSVTFLGNPVYPEILEKLLMDFSVAEVECINASVPGYSAFQGRQLLSKISDLDPDVVVVFFGWNDHWKAQGNITDQEQYSLGRGLRTASLLRALSARWRRERPTRVPVEDYREYLTDIRNTLTAWKSLPVFVTAPSGFQEGAMPGWAYRFFAEFYSMSHEEVAHIPSVHALYNNTARDVAGHGALLVDAERIFAAVPERRHLFRMDRIHLNASGHQLMARHLFQALQSLVGQGKLVPESRRTSPPPR